MLAALAIHLLRFEVLWFADSTATVADVEKGTLNTEHINDR